MVRGSNGGAGRPLRRHFRDGEHPDDAAVDRTVDAPFLGSASGPWKRENLCQEKERNYVQTNLVYSSRL